VGCQSHCGERFLERRTQAARAGQQVTTSVPIVVPVMGDPIGDGLVASLGHPGGNITGLTFLGPELLPKRLALSAERADALIVFPSPMLFNERRHIADLALAGSL